MTLVLLLVSLSMSLAVPLEAAPGTLMELQAEFQPGEPGIMWDYNCNFVGYDIANAKLTGEKCGQYCINNVNCDHFTWTKDGTCYAKHYTGPGNWNAQMNTNIGGVCGWYARPQQPSGGWKSDWRTAGVIYWDLNCDWNGYNYRTTANSGETCGPTCLQDSYCSHFTYINNQCILKHVPSGVNPQQIAGGGISCGYIEHRCSDAGSEWTARYCPTITLPPPPPPPPAPIPAPTPAPTPGGVCGASCKNFQTGCTISCMPTCTRTGNNQALCQRCLKGCQNTHCQCLREINAWACGVASCQ